ncbi:MAG: patatin-like phospholipase family protein [Bdellovibrio sp.]|nr:patatin-like phospholipase family protein [Bdellovibrio sp.]
MTKLYLLSLIAVSLMIALSAEAKRTRVGLVLGGGGARGLAHLGVLEVLEKNRIPVDCIVGTSAGSLIGGSYAAGETTANLKKKIKAANWNNLFYAQAPRQSYPFRRKQDDSYSMLDMELGLSDSGEIKLPFSAISTQQVELFLRSLTFGGTVANFDQLSIPYRAIATDLVTGEMVVLKDGDLVTAMRASMAVPGVFPSVPVQGRILVDGGLVRNLGVDVARKSCNVDAIIAIDVGAAPLKAEEISSILSIADQYTRLMMIQNVHPQAQSLTTKDVLIVPEFGTLSSMDFDKGDSLFEIGEKAANKDIEKLKKYSVSQAEYDEWQQNRLKKKLYPKPIDSVTVGSSGWVNPTVLKDALDIKTGQVLDQEDFNKRLTQLYARDDFSQLDYELIDDGLGQKLYIIPVQKSWGPNYLNFGLSLGTDFVNSSPWNVTAMYRRTWINSLGAEWKTIGQVGYSSMIKTEFYQPLLLGGYTFVSPYYMYNRSPLAVFQDGEQIAEYTYAKNSIGFDLGTGWGKYGELRLGPLYNDYKATQQIGPSLLPDVHDYDYGIHLNLFVDQLDNYFFPQKGNYVDIYGYLSLGGSESLDNYAVYGLNYRNGIGVGDGAFQMTIKAQASQGDTQPLANVSWLGGFLNLSSYRYQELIGTEYVYGSLQYYRPTGLLASSFWGAAAETGRVFDYTEEKVAQKWHYSGTLYFAYDSLLGPVYLALAYGDNYNFAGYFMLGKQF